MSTISIIGAGQVGATLAFLTLERKLGDVVLIDYVEGLAKGKALDIMQAGAITGFENSIIGTDDYSKIKGSEIVVITAGLPRKPGMSRLDLLKKNSEIVSSVVKEIAAYAPESIILVVTNPLDVMTYLAYKKSNFKPERVLGQAGVLDTARLKYFIAQECEVPAQEVSTMILGGHGDSMVPIISQTTVSEKPLIEMLSKEAIEKVIEKTRSGGAEIVSLLKTGSAYYAPAGAALIMMDAIVKDANSLLPASAYLNGEYGLKDIYVGVPVRLGREGIREVVEISLTDKEKEALHKSAAIYRQSIIECGMR
jgi:malate dehydrogenase